MTNYLLPLIFALLVSTDLLGSNQKISIQFYSEQIDLAYDDRMKRVFPVKINEKSMVNHFRKMNNLPYQPFLEALQYAKRKHQLNDWLFYQLMQKGIQEIYQEQNLVTRELVSWFLLTKAGFDTRLTYLKNKVYIYVYTKHELFEVPMIEDRGKNFVNLSRFRQSHKGSKALYLLNFTPNPKGKAFQFYLKKLPSLKPNIEEKEINFNHQRKKYTLKIKTDLTVVELMKNYPLIAESQYLEVPLSKSLTSSLVPQLRDLIKGKSSKEALEFLVAFTRNSFNYKEDKEYFGFSKPMIADEVFYYPYSDCEDRSALFYCLVKELLALPMIVIAFPDHLTIGVNSSEPLGTAIRYGGRPYYICDPTGPVNSAEIGEFPLGYEQKKYEVINKYK